MSVFAVILVGACATATLPRSTPFTGPSEWTSHIDLSEAKCADITGVFHNRGATRHEDGRITEDGLLAEQVFSRHLPRRRISTVAIDSHIDAGWLNATLVSGISRDISFAVSCRDGWHLFMETRSTKHLGDDLQAGQFEQQSWFRLDGEGRLVARVVSNATYRTDFQEVTQESSENWHRFEPVGVE